MNSSPFVKVFHCQTFTLYSIYIGVLAVLKAMYFYKTTLFSMMQKMLHFKVYVNFTKPFQKVKDRNNGLRTSLNTALHSVTVFILSHVTLDCGF